MTQNQTHYHPEIQTQLSRIDQKLAGIEALLHEHFGPDNGMPKRLRILESRVRYMTGVGVGIGMVLGAAVTGVFVAMGVM